MTRTRSLLSTDGPLVPVAAGVTAVVVAIGALVAAPEALTLAVALAAMVAVLVEVIAVMGRLLADDEEQPHQVPVSPTVSSSARADAALRGSRFAH